MSPEQLTTFGYHQFIHGMLLGGFITLAVVLQIAAYLNRKK